jgi:quinolinate synthase
MFMTQQELINKINELKKAKNAVIFAHNYELGEIQDIADFCGDSLELSIKAANIDCDLIVFCGVKFMAETAKILSPNKKVILPIAYAGCDMADMIDGEKLREIKKDFQMQLQLLMSILLLILKQNATCA